MRKNKRTAEDLLDAFQNFVDYFYIEHENVYMRIFVQSLDRDVRNWFRTLPPRSINSWKVLEYTFLQQWGEKKDFQHYLSELFSLRKQGAENVEEFNKLYHKISSTIQPTETIAMVAYSAAFELDFSVALRERRSIMLLLMQADGVALEGNLIAAGKIKCMGIKGPGYKRKEKKDKNKTKDDPKPSSSVKEYPKVKIEERCMPICG